MTVIYCYLGTGKGKVFKFHMISASYFQISVFHFSLSPSYKSCTLKDGNLVIGKLKINDFCIAAKNWKRFSGHLAL